MTKPLERQKARELREAGMPYKRIAATLGVSPSSAYAWTSDVELSDEQKAANLRGPRGPLNPEETCAGGRRHGREGPAVYGAIQEYAGFEEPAWLDCSY